MPAPLTDWRAGQPKSARHLNQLVDRARQWENTGGNVLVERMPNGTDLWAPEDYTPFIDIRPGIISAPPSSGLTVSPPYAWAKYARPKPGGIDTAVELELAPPPPDTEAGSGFYTEPYPVLVRVVGPPGVSAAIGTEGLMVQVWDLGTDADPARPHWLFVTAGSSALLVRLDSNVTAGTGGGGYNGTLMAGATTDDGSGNLALPEGLTAGASVLVRNADEDAQPTHWLLADGTAYALGQYAGMSTEATPRPTIFIPRGKARAASPSTLGAAAEGSETASTDTWNRTLATAGTDYGDSPLTIYAICRVVYNHAGDKKLYAMHRALTFAADGRLHSVGAETRVEVDATEVCT